MKHFPFFVILISFLVSCNSTKSISQRSGDILWNTPLTAQVGGSSQNKEINSDAIPFEHIQKENTSEVKTTKNPSQSYKSTEKNAKIKPSLKSVIQFKKELKKINKASSKSEGGNIDGFALAGFICGILGFIFLFTLFFPFGMGLLAVIFSAIGLSTTSDGKAGKGFAIAGLILGILTILLFWLVVAALVAIFAAII